MGPEPSYKWSHSPKHFLLNEYFWGYFTLLIGVINPCITGRGPPCRNMSRFAKTLIVTVAMSMLLGICKPSKPSIFLPQLHSVRGLCFFLPPSDHQNQNHSSKIELKCTP